MMKEKKGTIEKRARRNVLGKVIMLFLLAAIMTVSINLIWFPAKKKKSEEAQEKPKDTITIDENGVENGIHVATGFVDGPGLQTVVQNCTACHSAKLVTQNRMTREQWKASIRWMQATQNLWDLGDNEKVILDYLSVHYAPDMKGRRENLKVSEWYALDE